MNASHYHLTEQDKRQGYADVIAMDCCVPTDTRKMFDNVIGECYARGYRQMKIIGWVGQGQTARYTIICGR